MSNKILSVNLILENCESISITVDNILFLNYDMDKKHFFLSVDKELMSWDRSSFFNIGVKNLDKLVYDDTSRNMEDLPALTRIETIPDITSVEIHLDNGVEYFLVPWKSGFDCINMYQKLRKSKSGYWILSIRKVNAIVVLLRKLKFLLHSFITNMKGEKL